jgi:hypothetical protein
MKTRRNSNEGVLNSRGWKKFERREREAKKKKSLVFIPFYFKTVMIFSSFARELSLQSYLIV